MMSQSLPLLHGEPRLEPHWAKSLVRFGIKYWQFAVTLPRLTYSSDRHPRIEIVKPRSGATPAEKESCGLVASAPRGPRALKISGNRPHGACTDLANTTVRAPTWRIPRCVHRPEERRKMSTPVGDTASAMATERIAIGSRTADFRIVPPESEDFVTLCLETLGLQHCDVRIDGSGRRNLVILHPDSNSVFRFPRVQVDAESLEESALRHHAAAQLGLPVPPLLGHVTGPAGTAHLQVRLINGTGLDQPMIQGLAARQPVRIGRQLAALLIQLRDISPARWSSTGVNWSELWTDLLNRVSKLEHHVPVDFFESVSAAVERAHDASQNAHFGLVHGDVGGVNTRFDDHGRLTGVLDWDGAGIGDVAADVAAVAAGIPTPAREAMIATFPEFQIDIERCDRYVETWAGQGALWAIEVGDEVALNEMIVRERSRSRED